MRIYLPCSGMLAAVNLGIPARPGHFYPSPNSGSIDILMCIFGYLHREISENSERRYVHCIVFRTPNMHTIPTFKFVLFVLYV